MTVADPRVALQDRLAEMREAIVAEMIRTGFSAGAGALLGQIAAAADALENPLLPPLERGNGAARETPPEGDPLFPALPCAALRAVVSDEGDAIRVAVHEGDRVLAVVALDMREAVGLVIGLTDAISAHRRLAR